MNKKFFIFFGIAFSLCFIVALIVPNVNALKYNEDWIKGKTSEEIIEKYGEFSWCLGPPDDDGVYRSTKCSYELKPAKIGFLGTTPPKLFSIVFDDSGIAIECYKEYGGYGG